MDTVVSDLTARADGRGGARDADAAHGALAALGQVLGRPGVGAGVAPALARAALRTIAAQAAAARFGALQEAALGALAAAARVGVLPLEEGDAGGVEAEARALRGGGAILDALASGGGWAPRDEAPPTRAQLVGLLLRLGAGRHRAAAAAAAAGGMEVDGGGEEEEGEGGAGAAGGAQRSAGAHTEAAVVALGALASGELAGAAAGAGEGCAPPLPPIARAALQALFAFASAKLESVQLAVGAALSEVASARPAAVAKTEVVGVLADPTSGTLAAYGSTLAVGGGGAAEAGGAAAPAPAARALRAAASGAIIDVILSTEGPVVSPRSLHRAAAAVWLLQLLHGWGAGAAGGARALGWEALPPRLPRLQAALTRLLGEKSPLTQDSAAAALSLLYDAADGVGRRSLTGALVESLTTGALGAAVTLPAAPPPAALEGAGAGAVVDGGSPAGASPPTPSSSAPPPAGPAALSLSAGGDASYRELCAVATSLGAPDLLYRFLALAGHAAAWHRRGGAGLGLEALLRSRARADVEPHLVRLIPKLLRYQFDPSARVREPMTRLWSALVREPRAAVAAHIGAILSDLIAASASEAWREREAACAALAHVLPGRAAGEVVPHLASLWRAALRAIDDVKDSVREAGLTALGAVGKLTLSLAAPGEGAGAPERASAEAVVGVALPFLLREGVAHALPPAAAQCVTYLRALVKVAAGPLLRPYVPELAAAALASASAMEATALSYIQAHADGGSALVGGMRGEEVEGARLRAAGAAPLADALERCLDVVGATPTAELLAHASPLPALVDALRAAVRGGVGLPTRGAAARFIVGLAGAAGEAMRPHAGALLKTLEAAVGDPSPTLRAEFARAGGAVARWAKPAAVGGWVRSLCVLGGSGEARARATGAAGLAALLRAAAERAGEWTPLVAPLAFWGVAGMSGVVGGEEGDAEAGAWETLWEAVASSRAAVARLYGHELCERVCGALRSASWALQRGGARAAREWVACVCPAAGGGGGDAPQACEVADGAGCWEEAHPLPVAAELSPHVEQLVDAVLHALRTGRAWEGKEDVVAALGVVAAYAGGRGRWRWGEGCGAADDGGAAGAAASGGGAIGLLGCGAADDGATAASGGGDGGAGAARPCGGEAEAGAEEDAAARAMVEEEAPSPPPAPPPPPPPPRAQTRALPLRAVVEELLRAASRGGSEAAFSTAACDAFALVLRAHPSAARGCTTPLLPQLLPGGGAGGTPAWLREGWEALGGGGGEGGSGGGGTATAAAAAAPFLRGRRANEEAAGEAAAAARAAAAAAAAAQAAALAAAVAAAAALAAAPPQGGGERPSELPALLAALRGAALRCAGGAPLLRARLHAAAAHAAARAPLRLLLEPSGSFDWTPRALLGGGSERCAPPPGASHNEPVAAVLLRWAWDATKGEVRFASARARALDGLAAVAARARRAVEDAPPAAAGAAAEVRRAAAAAREELVRWADGAAAAAEPAVGEAAMRAAAALARV